MTPRAVQIIIVPVLFCLAQPPCLQAVDVWRNPEIAGKNTLFIDVTLAALPFDSGFDFVLPPPVEIRADYLLPVFLPFSVGAFFKTPDPNLKSFGGRLGYHFDFRSPKLDLYLLYAFDCGFVRNPLLEEYGDDPQPVRYYDFRVGLRRFFGSPFGLSLETGFKMRELCIALSIKLL